MRFFIQTFGCQMNRLDSELAADVLRMRGLEQATRIEDADIVLFNTCSVREHAENRFLSHLGRLKHAKQIRPDLTIGVLGCMAERAGKVLIKRMPHVDFVCGPGRLGLLAQILQEAPAGRAFTGFLEDDCITSHRAPRKGTVKAFVSAMRGCVRGCSYCVVPSARGPERSRSMKEIIEEIHELEECGVREVTLLGQSIDRYKGGANGGLADLLHAVQRECSLDRVRFVTSHPAGVTNVLLEAMAELPVVCRSVHMPAQSGSDRILKAMGRGYTREQYLAIVERARKLMPEIEFSSDVIVGFPGETEEDSEATMRVMDRCRFLQSFIFKYSPRPGTRASTLRDDVPADVKAARHSRILDRQNRITLEKHEQLVGNDVEVLVEGPSKRDPSRFAGRTALNHIVIVDGTGPRPGDLVSVRVESCTALSVYGSIVRSPEKASP